MNIYANTTTTTDNPPEAGWHFARVFAFVGLGLQATTYEGRSSIKPTFVLGLRLVDSGGRFSVYWKQYRVAHGPRATYKPHMNQANWWQNPMDPTQLVGKTALAYFQDEANKDGFPSLRLVNWSPATTPPAGWPIDKAAFMADATFTVEIKDSVPEAFLAKMPDWLANPLRAAAPVVPTGYGQQWAPPPPPPPVTPAPPIPPPCAPPSDDEGW